MMAVIGHPLTSPESAWKRIETTDSKFNFSSGWATLSSSDYSGGSTYYTQSPDISVEFKFHGTDFRIIESIAHNRTKRVDVYIDGVFIESFSQYIAGTQNNTLVYEKTLPEGEHVIKLINKGTTGEYCTFDAIDIKDTSYMMDYPIGKSFTSPESGWKRYDDKDSMFIYKGSWSSPAQSSAYGGSYKTAGSPVTRDSHSVEFTFYGTKLRLFGVIFAQAPSQCFIEIDGTEYTFSEYGNTVYQALVFEKLGLSLDKHKVKVTSIMPTGGSFYFDAIDIDDTGYLTATVGSQLTTPEAGWKRYDETSIAVGGSGWTRTVNASHWNGSILEKQTPTVDNVFKFRFYGTKLRIIDYKTTSRGDRTITVDGVPYTYSSNSPTTQAQVLVFEKADLSLGFHEVSIVSSSGSWFSLDAIDIDFNGRLLHPDEVTDVSQLEVGKRIRCNYVISASSVVGVYNNLGKETDPFISTSGLIPPIHRGDFYFIMTDEYNGKKILIADRNIQSYMPWDVLNNSGLVFGAPVDMGDERFSFVSRILSGGINSDDTDNEWYKYIVSSTLNNSIIAGDNGVWNWSSGSAYSWTTTTSTTSAAYRMRRGSSAVNAANAPATSSATGASGYRPLFEVEILPLNRTFINHDGLYKKYEVDNATWNTISATLPSEDTFINDGMDDLSVFDRKNEDFVQTMTANGSLGSGKLFKGSIDLKKYFEITKLTVK